MVGRWRERAYARRYARTAARRPTGALLELLKARLRLRFDMATCPNCGVSSRQDPMAMTIEPWLQAKPLGTWSLAGRQVKTVAVMMAKLSCRCGWSIVGRLEDGQLVVDPPKD